MTLKRFQFTLRQEPSPISREREARQGMGDSIVTGNALTATVLLLTCNQQDFVADALSAILNQQTSDPFQVLVSDDHSTDGTWGIIQHIVSAYKGPHQITLNQNAKNLGINPHLNQCIAKCNTDIIIAAAGDDISHSTRVDRIVKAFKDTGALLVHSDAISIDRDGRPMLTVRPKTALERGMPLHKLVASPALYLGATGAWHKSLFSIWGDLPTNACYEDQVLGFRAALKGGVTYIDDPLVNYRVGVGIGARDRPEGSLTQWRTGRIAHLNRMCDVISARRQDAQVVSLAALLPFDRALVEYKGRLAYYEHSMHVLRFARISKIIRQLAWYLREKLKYTKIRKKLT